MVVLALDLGGTKLALGTFSATGDLKYRQSILLQGCSGKELGKLIAGTVAAYISSSEEEVAAIAISVPGISNIKDGTVWAPNIPGWTSYKLYDEVKEVCGDRPLVIESDRSCYILGEVWKGGAVGCQNAIYLAVGTGIGAGILVDGRILRGANDIAGAIGWMALNPPFNKKYVQCGNYEYFASGEGIARLARELLMECTDYQGDLNSQQPELLTAYDVFQAYDSGDSIAVQVFNKCIEYWGMSVANLVSLFNPEKIIMGGGVFGPATRFIPQIWAEAIKWAQPVSSSFCVLEKSSLNIDAGLYGAAYAALQQVEVSKK